MSTSLVPTSLFLQKPKYVYVKELSVASICPEGLALVILCLTFLNLPKTALATMDVCGVA